MLRLFQEIQNKQGKSNQADKKEQYTQNKMDKAKRQVLIAPFC